LITPHSILNITLCPFLDHSTLNPQHHAGSASCIPLACGEMMKGLKKFMPSSGKGPVPTSFVVSDPHSVVHRLHVDNDLSWSLEDPEASFEFVEKLGEGSFGSVHKAVHKASGYTIALKIVQADFDADESSSIQREINILKSCKSKFVGKLFWKL